MRVEIVLMGENGELRLPRQYNEILQGFLYRNLKASLGDVLHDQGFPDPKNVNRRLRLFVFSRLLGRWETHKEEIAFKGPVRWIVSTPWAALLSAWAERFLKSSQLRLNDQSVRLLELHVLSPLEYRNPIKVVTLSPITVYRTLEGANGRRKTYYFSPFEREFRELLLENLARKVRAWTGKEVPAEGAVRPVKVRKSNEHIVLYKGTVIKAWSGIYELELPEELFSMAFDAGLGAKNSQGFGCIAPWSEHERKEGEVRLHRRWPS